MTNDGSIPELPPRSEHPQRVGLDKLLDAFATVREMSDQLSGLTSTCENAIAESDRRLELIDERIGGHRSVGADAKREACISDWIVPYRVGGRCHENVDT